MISSASLKPSSSVINPSFSHRRTRLFPSCPFGEGGLRGFLVYVKRKRISAFCCSKSLTGEKEPQRGMLETSENGALTATSVKNFTLKNTPQAHPHRNHSTGQGREEQWCRDSCFWLQHLLEVTLMQGSSFFHIPTNVQHGSNGAKSMKIHWWRVLQEAFWD